MLQAVHTAGEKTNMEKGKEKKTPHQWGKVIWEHRI